MTAALLSENNNLLGDESQVKAEDTFSWMMPLRESSEFSLSLDNGEIFLLQGYRFRILEDHKIFKICVEFKNEEIGRRVLEKSIPLDYLYLMTAAGGNELRLAMEPAKEKFADKLNRIFYTFKSYVKRMVDDKSEDNTIEDEMTVTFQFKFFHF